MGNHGFNAGGFAYMDLVQCRRCGASFKIGKRNPRRVCSNVRKCDARIARKQLKAVPHVQ